MIKHVSICLRIYLFLVYLVYILFFLLNVLLVLPKLFFKHNKSLCDLYIIFKSEETWLLFCIKHRSHAIMWCYGHLWLLETMPGRSSGRRNCKIKGGSFYLVLYSQALLFHSYTPSLPFGKFTSTFRITTRRLKLGIIVSPVGLVIGPLKVLGGIFMTVTHIMLW